MVPQHVAQHAGPAKKQQHQMIVKLKVDKKKIPVYCFLGLEVRQGPLDAHAAAELAVLDTDGSTKNTWGSFFGEESLAAAVDVVVAARTWVVVELADAAKLAAAGARDGDERGENDAVRLDGLVHNHLVPHVAGVLHQLVGRADAVLALPGLLLELGGSHCPCLALRGQVSLRKRLTKKTE